MLARLRKAAVAALVVVSFTLIVGRVYEVNSARRDRGRLPEIGHLVDVGDGRSLNIFCSGTGTPPVILEVAHGPGYFWADIQPEIAKFTTACWYDRAGEGWSDAGSYPRTSVSIAKDLHTLLHRSSLPAPYVLAGWSFGGLTVRVFNGVYPEDVSGMVLIDSAHEDEPLRAPKFFLSSTAPPFARYPLHLLLETAAWSGALRLLQPGSHNPHNSTRQDITRALRQQPKSIVTDITTGLTVPESYKEAQEFARPGDKPLIVLTAGRPQPWSDPEMARQAAAYQQVWIHEIQVQLLRLSSKGKQIIVQNSDHGIPDEAPDAVISAIQEVTMTARAEQNLVQ
jgi:pimeloyl-ACP methyl ester carboxylesterase